jgi:uncharacterized protein (TIGR03435 family)
MSLPMRAQLPTMSDVDRGSDAPAPGPLPAWDVALVKSHPAEDQTMSWQMTADGLSLVNLPLEQMICSAWDLKPYQVSGLSEWMKNSTYDLTAKVTGDDVDAYKKLNTAQRRQMLQTLLSERFKLKTHMETKTLPVYDLVLDKGGSKLKPTTALEAPSEAEMRANPDKYKKGYMMMGPGMYEATGVPVKSLTSQLSNALGKPVLDTTGLKGLYDITLHFRPEDAVAGSGDDADKPSVFSAVQDQLGLKLVPGKAPVETLVVDAAEKPPAN